MLEQYAPGVAQSGQEAAQVGSGRAMDSGDYAFPTYREHGVAYCRGVDPLKLLGLFRGATHTACGADGFCDPGCPGGLNRSAVGKTAIALPSRWPQ